MDPSHNNEAASLRTRKGMKSRARKSAAAILCMLIIQRRWGNTHWTMESWIALQKGSSYGYRDVLTYQRQGESLYRS